MKRFFSSAAVFALLATLARGAAGQGAVSYQAVPQWPSGGSQAPQYRRAQVSAVATDKQGRVFVFQRARNAMLVFNRDGQFLQAWGQGMFSTPHGCRVDPDGNVWVTDLDRHQVLKFTPEGQLLASYGQKWRKGSDSRHFNEPADVAFGPEGDVFVADGYGNSRVVHLSRDGEFLNAWGTKGRGLGQFRLVHSIAVGPDGLVYVSDRSNGRVQIFTPQGQFVNVWYTGAVHSLWITPDGRVFAGGTRKIKVYNLQGQQVGLLRKVKEAHMLCVDDQDALYVADVSARRVRKSFPLQ